MDDSIQIEIESSAFLSVLAKLASRTEDMTPILRNVSERMLQSVEENFLTEGKNLGQKWASLKDSTIKDRQKHRYTPIKILTRGGKLASSIASNYDSENAGVGTNLKYAKIHQFGFDNNVNIPSHTRKSIKGKTFQVKAFTKKLKVEKRPYLALSQDDVQDILIIFEDALWEVF